MDLAGRFAALLEPRGVVAGEAARPFGRDYRKLVDAPPLVVLQPASTAEVAAALKLCAELKLPVVPQGGNTGLCAGAVPSAPEAEVVLSLARMNRLRGIDADNFAMAVDAGCILAEVQAAAAAAGRLFPLRFGAEGSAQIGGALATNAGGNAVLRYGNARDLVLGLEVVLADGTVLDMMRALRKDNTGLDLKQLFIGSEGILGVITGAVLKLYPAPVQRRTAVVAFRDVHAAVSAFAAVRGGSADRLTAFELMPHDGLELATRIPSVALPLATPWPWYALIELSSSRAEDPLEALLESLLADLMEQGFVEDGVVAASEAQRARLWRLREALVEAHNGLPHVVKHDVSVPISAIARFIEAATAQVAALYPEVMVVAFGHVGDGNVHFNLCQRDDRPAGELARRERELTDAVYALVASESGSISAEHGIGRLKRSHLAAHRSRAELAAMAAVKRALDPEGRMNPGKVLG